MTFMTIRSVALGAVASAALVMPPQAQAQAQPQGTDSRWLPFVGCWEAVGGEEEVGLLCFRLEENGVQLTNVVAGEVASTEFLAADGEPRDVSAEGCEGWEAVQFSGDGRRVFTRTEFLCGSDEARTGTGVMTFLATNMWSDIRTLDVGGEPFSWIQDYQLAGADRLAEEGLTDPAQGLGMAVRSARMAASAAIDLEDIEEAVDFMDAKAIETWVVSQRDAFQLTGRDLVRLADAGVPDNVIDAVVAVSFPNRFLADASGQIDPNAQRPTSYRGYMAYNPFWGPAWGLSIGFGYAPYGYGYGAYRPRYGGYYGPGYGYPGYGYGYGGSRPGYIVVGPRPSGGTVQNGRGYTQGRGSSSGTARPRGSGGQPSYSTGGSRSSAGSRPSGSSAGRRSAGGATSTPRRAQRRRPGGESSASQAARRTPRSSRPAPAASRPAPRVSRPAASPSRGARPAASRSRGARPAASRSSGSRPAASRPSRSSGGAARSSGGSRGRSSAARRSGRRSGRR
jgi:hypothetical protein